jgi:GntR family transcriptional regulator
MTNHTSISQRLHESLRTLIANKKPGEKLPSEPTLAKQLGVSRATLREAMRTFEIQGIIRRRQGDGTYVIHPSQVIESGLEILESIETMARRIGLVVKMGELKVEKRNATAEESAALGIPGTSGVVQIIRVMHAESRPVAYLVDILPEQVLDPEELTKDFTGSVLDLLLHRGAPSLLSSRCEINVDSASHDIARALGIQRRDGLLRFKSYLYTAEGRVVDYAISYFLPGYFRFHVIRRIGELNNNVQKTEADKSASVKTGH